MERPDVDRASKKQCVIFYTAENLCNVFNAMLSETSTLI